MRWSGSAAAVMVVVLVVGCGGGLTKTSPSPSPTTTTITAPSTSPSCKPIVEECDPAISDAAVLKVVAARCMPCHGDGGIAGYPFTEAAALAFEPTADRVATCEMPPDGAPLPSPEERAIVVGWAACRKLPTHL